jgi:hypothetical protein
MQDVLAKLKEIQENYDNEDIQRAITAAEKTAVAEEEAVSEEAVVEETVEEATDEVVDEAEETVEEDSVEEVHEEEVVEESVDNSDFERMLKLAGRSGVMGMNTNVIVAESVEVVEDEVSEEAFIAKEADVDEDDEEEVDESFETVEEEEVEETVEVPVSALSELMKLAGYEQYKIDEYANEPEEEYSSAEDQMDLGGGLNGPKKAYAAAAGGDNPMDQEPTEIEEDNKLTFEGMYKRYMTQVVEESLEEKE